MAGGRARTLMSRMETRASSLIICFIFADCHKQGIISVYEDTKVWLARFSKDSHC